MKTVKRIVTLILCAVVFLTLSACSSKKAEKLQIYSGSQQEAYLNAAKKHFSNVSWTSEDDPQNADSISDDTRYVVILSGEEEVLNRAPVGGKRYTVLVYDNGSDDIRIHIHYNVGTTENCVFQGNMVKGEMNVSNQLDISATGLAKDSERAESIFNALYEELINIEGE